MEKVFIPLNDLILIEKLERKESDGSGFEVMMSEKTEKVLTGTVVHSPDMANLPAGTVVAYEEFDAAEISISGKKMHLVRTNNIMGYFEEVE